METNKVSVKKNFKFDKNKSEYVIKLRKKCKWCWLLLLLLLLLLIRFNDNINYILIDKCNNKTIQGSEITINYNNNKDIKLTQTKITDANGEVTFTIKGRRIYEKIFGIDPAHNYEITANTIEASHIIATNTGLLKKLIKHKTELIIDKKEDFIVKVVKAEDETFNIENAEIKLKYFIDSKESVVSGKSDSLGNYTFIIPICANKIELYANKKGYSSDSLDTDYASAKTNPDKRKLKLKPKQEKPCKNCRAFFTDNLVDDGTTYSEAYKIDQYSDYVGAGNYPDASKAFPRASSGTFDGIAIDKGTRVIIYKEKNFKGAILLDRSGPLIINNAKHKGLMPNFETKIFKEPIQTLFPQGTREWSNLNMNLWSKGSVKVICNN